MRKDFHCINLDGTKEYMTLQVWDGYKHHGKKVWVDGRGEHIYIVKKVDGGFIAFEIIKTA